MNKNYFDLLVTRICNENGRFISDNKQTLSYAEAFIIAQHASQKLQSNYLRNSPIIISMPNSVDLIIAIWACILAGIQFLLVFHKSSDEEMRSYCKEVNAQALLGDKSIVYFRIDDLVKFIDFHDLIKDETINVQSNSPVDIKNFLLHTSGTSGSSKIVVHRQESIVENARLHAESSGLHSNDRGLIILPLAFSFVFTCQFIAYTSLNCSFHLANQPFFYGDLKRVCSDREITTINLSPFHIKQMRLTDNFIPRPIRSIYVAGSALPLHVLTNLCQKNSEVDVIINYGMTELGPRVTTWRSQLHSHKIGSVGLPVSGVMVKIKKLPGSQAGEILISSPTRMVGYFLTKNHPEETLWFSSGDYGYLDHDGFLYISGRLKNIIIVGGVNVCPEEIEMIILQLDFVEKCKVLGEKLDYGDERLVAMVILRQPILDAAERIRNHCRKVLSAYKVPREIIFTDTIRTTHSGKIYRGET